jgi:formate dehydrogenase subunit gamma
MRRMIKTAAIGAALALGLLFSAHAQQGAAGNAAPAAKGPPAGFVAPAEPAADETNAVRARTQPGNNAPMWRGVVGTGEAPGYTSIPGAETGVLIQQFVQYPGSRYATAGEAWRQTRNNWIIPYGGSLLLIVLLALGVFYWRKGSLGGHTPDTGRLIERFTPLERAVPWTTAVSFAVLGISGLVMAFGKFFLLPIIGATLFGWLSYALKTLHNFVGPLFAVSLVIFIATYVRDNLPHASDMAWFKAAGGLFSGKEVASHRYNAGEKVVFWGGAIVLGLVVVGSGLVLDLLVPGFGETRGQMQIAHMVHAAASALMMAMFLGHIYMGTLGVSGAYKAMRTGYVDEAWARDHHELWYEDIKAGRIPAQRSASAAPPASLKTGQA